MNNDKIEIVLTKLKEIRGELRHGTGIVNRYLRDMIEEAFIDALIIDALKHDGSLNKIDEEDGYDAYYKFGDLIENERNKMLKELIKRRK